MKKYEIILRIDVDETEEFSPDKWDWNALIDMGYGDVEVVKCEEVQ